MLEVLFSEAAKYSMKRAMQNKNNPMMVDTKELVFIGPHLDIGDLSSNPCDYERQKSLSEILANQLTRDNSEKLANKQGKEMDKLLRAAKEGETIRIWKSDAPFSASAFSFVCYQLKDIPTDIRVFSLKNTLSINENILISYSHWGELAPEDYDSSLVNERKLSRIEKESQAEAWQVLKEENSLLRAVVNGKLLSVPENFYDHLLIKHFPEDTFLLGELIAKVLGTYPLAVSDSWYLYRIKEMIREKKLERTGTENTSSPYEQRLKKIR